MAANMFGGNQSSGWKKEKDDAHEAAKEMSGMRKDNRRLQDRHLPGVPELDIDDQLEDAEELDEYNVRALEAMKANIAMAPELTRREKASRDEAAATLAELEKQADELQSLETERQNNKLEESVEMVQAMLDLQPGLVVALEKPTRAIAQQIQQRQDSFREELEVAKFKLESLEKEGASTVERYQADISELRESLRRAKRQREDDRSEHNRASKRLQQSHEDAQKEQELVVEKLKAAEERSKRAANLERQRSVDASVAAENREAAARATERSLTAEIDTLKAREAAAVQKVEVHETRIAQLERSEAVEKLKVTVLENEVSIQKQYVCDFKGRLAKRDLRVAELEKDAAAQVQHVTTLEGRLAVRDSRVVELEDGTSAQAEKIAKIERTSSAQAEKISGLERDLENTTTRLSDVQYELQASLDAEAASNVKYEELCAELDAKSLRCRTLTEQKALCDDQIAQLKEEASTRQSTVVELNEALAQHVAFRDAFIRGHGLGNGAITNDLSQQFVDMTSKASRCGWGPATPTSLDGIRLTYTGDVLDELTTSRSMREQMVRFWFQCKVGVADIEAVNKMLNGSLVGAEDWAGVPFLFEAFALLVHQLSQIPKRDLLATPGKLG